jgi:hypothetical protein
MRQYIRKVRATFSGSTGSLVVNPGGIAKHEMKIAFDISKGIESSQNTAVVGIWNLNEGHRNAVGKELDNITLEAGYIPPGESGNVGIIFKGQMRDVEHRRDGPDIITRLSCGDGDKAFRRAAISKTFPKGTKVEDVVEELYKQMEKEGIDRGEWKFPQDMPPYKRPYSMCGSCTRELDTIGRGRGFYWSSQNGVMEIMPADGYIGGIVLITPETGMIDTPTITDNGVKVSALLNPEIRPGRRVRIESQTLEMNAEGGEYRVSQCAYNGDNRDGDFRVEIQGESIKGGKVDQGIKP